MNNIYVMATMAALFWGANFNLAIPVVAELGPYIAGASRYILAAIIMLLIVRIKRDSIPLTYCKSYATLGIVGVFGFNLFFLPWHGNHLGYQWCIDYGFKSHTDNFSRIFNT